MTEINSDEKAKAKAAAANAALKLNDASLAYGAAAAVVGVAGAVSLIGAAPAGVVAGTLAVCAFAIGVAGNRYQRLANDPPRDDFDVVTVSSARFTGVAASSGDVNASATVLAAHHFILADAIDALVTSLERYDGAVAAANSGAADTQAAAVGQNATAAQAAFAVIADAAAAINGAWAAAADINWAAATADDMHSQYLAAAGPPVQEAGPPLSSVLATVADVSNPAPFDNIDPAADAVMVADALPAQPSTLYSQPVLDALSDATAILTGLADQGGQV